MTLRAERKRPLAAARERTAAALLLGCLASHAAAQAVPPGLAGQDGAPLPGLIDSVADPKAGKPADLSLPKPAGAGAALTLPRRQDAAGGPGGPRGADPTLPRVADGRPGARQQRGLDAEAQNRGDYPVMKRRAEEGAPDSSGPYQDAGLRSVPLGRIQPAWDDAVPAPGQIEPGTVRFPFRVNRVMPLRLRLGMPTTVVLPPCEAISRVVFGDEDSFPWEIPDGHHNLVLVRPDRAGVDTAMQVIAKSGRLYTFYLRAETVKAVQVTDLTAFVDDDAHCARSAGTPRGALSVDVGPNGAAGGGPRGLLDRAGLHREERVPAGGKGSDGDFAVSRPFRVEDLSFEDIRVFAPDEASRVLGPVRAFHDGRRTFLDYGERMGSTRLPAAFRLVDGVDQPVAVRWAGARGQILVIDAVGDMTLKSGELYLCIRNRFQPAAGSAAVVDAKVGRTER